MFTKLKTEKEKHLDSLRSGFDLLDSILSQATEGLNVVCSNFHYSYSGADWNATIYYKGWILRKKICDVTFYDSKLFIHSKYPCFGQDLSQNPTKNEISKIRHYIENIMYNMNLLNNSNGDDFSW